MTIARSDPRLHARPGRPWFRRLWTAALIALAVALPIGAVGYMLYSGLLAHETHRFEVPYDGLYWNAVQFQIAWERFEAQVLMYRANIDEDAQSVRACYDLLRARLEAVSENTVTPDGHEGLRNRQQEILRQLHTALDSIQPDIDGLGAERQRTMHVIGVLRQNDAVVAELASGRRLMDVGEREAIVHDFEATRRYLMYSGIVLGLMSAVATVLLLLNGYR